MCRKKVQIRTEASVAQLVKRITSSRMVVDFFRSTFNKKLIVRTKVVKAVSSS